MRPDPDGNVPAHQPHCLGCGPASPASKRIDGRKLHLDLPERWSAWKQEPIA